MTGRRKNLAGQQWVKPDDDVGGVERVDVDV
jgi:hypothetical protein